MPTPPWGVRPGLFCSSDFIAEGIYRGKLVMSDGSKNVKLKLLPYNTARMRELFDCVVEGTWERERLEGLRRMEFEFPSTFLSSASS
ncbi:hypothetical protein N9D63_07280 [Opitutales bacterium]|nr:hypothetical protein [Opitutales bacterium]